MRPVPMGLLVAALLAVGCAPNKPDAFKDTQVKNDVPKVVPDKAEGRFVKTKENHSEPLTELVFTEPNQWSLTHGTVKSSGVWEMVDGRIVFRINGAPDRKSPIPYSGIRGHVEGNRLIIQHQYVSGFSPPPPDVFHRF